MTTNEKNIMLATLGQIEHEIKQEIRKGKKDKSLKLLQRCRLGSTVSALRDAQSFLYNVEAIDEG